MLATPAGAPLRAMAGLAMIWIGLRVISWNSAAELAWLPVQPATHHAARQGAGRERRALIALPLTDLKERAADRGVQPPFLAEDIAARHGPDLTMAGQSASDIAGISGRPWQYPDDMRGFFLQASFTGPPAGSGNRATALPRFPAPPALHQSNRWAAYFWIYARQGTSTGPARPGLPSNGQYGGSQAGAILSYRLLDRPIPELSLYGRLSAALDPWSEQEFAAGTRIRPVRGIPVALHAEQRLDLRSGEAAGTALFVAGGTGPDPIVERIALETYAQAGYVLGKNETYFFDGSATLQRPVAEFDGKKLSVGAGLWAGGQRDITRLDLGPRASLELPVGLVMTRIALDGRVRIAGDARPGNGAALTISTSF